MFGLYICVLCVEFDFTSQPNPETKQFRRSGGCSPQACFDNSMYVMLPRQIDAVTVSEPSLHLAGYLARTSLVTIWAVHIDASAHGRTTAIHWFHQQKPGCLLPQWTAGASSTCAEQEEHAQKRESHLIRLAPNSIIREHPDQTPARNHRLYIARYKRLYKESVYERLGERLHWHGT